MFSELGLVPALAEAIAARGYDNATPVQAAVLEAKVQGRDLLVSSQTGSGKTLAFGSLIAQTLLEDPAPATGDGPEAARPARRVRRPGALIIAPTRELANQVRAELAWLFARTPLSVAAFTGGSDIRRDLKILHTGADLVVGTPGRLVDLLSRKALHLEEVKAVVVDEADEMLDMGFREDLETILAAATARTRTHMFSATLPQPILALAAVIRRTQPASMPAVWRSTGLTRIFATWAYLTAMVTGARRWSTCFATTPTSAPSCLAPPEKASPICTASWWARGFARWCCPGIARRPNAIAHSSPPRGRGADPGGHQCGRTRSGSARGGPGRARRSSTQW